MGNEPLHHALQMVSVCVMFSWGVFYFPLGAFLMKPSFHSWLLNMKWLKPTWHYTSRWLSTISYPTCTRGIIIIYYQHHHAVYSVYSVQSVYSEKNLFQRCFWGNYHKLYINKKVINCTIWKKVCTVLAVLLPLDFSLPFFTTFHDLKDNEEW